MIWCSSDSHNHFSVERSESLPRAAKKVAFDSASLVFTWTFLCISETVWKDSCGWPGRSGEFLHQVSIDELQSSVNRKILLLLLSMWQVTLLPCLSQQFNSYLGNGFGEVMWSQALEPRQAGRSLPAAICWLLLQGLGAWRGPGSKGLNGNEQVKPQAGPL